MNFAIMKILKFIVFIVFIPATIVLNLLVFFVAAVTMCNVGMTETLLSLELRGEFPYQDEVIRSSIKVFPPLAQCLFTTLSWITIATFIF